MAPIGSCLRVPNAEQLAANVASGRPLPVMESPILLGHGEVLHAEAAVAGWRFHAVDVLVEQRHPVAAGLLTFGLSSAAAAIGNRRTRRQAAETAAPQWRPLGAMPVLATNQRLLLLHDGAWASVWYSAIRHLLPCPQQDRLELSFEADPPYLFIGADVPYLTVVIATVLAQGYGIDAIAAMVLTA